MVERIGNRVFTNPPPEQGLLIALQAELELLATNPHNAEALKAVKLLASQIEKQLPANLPPAEREAIESLCNSLRSLNPENSSQLMNLLGQAEALCRLYTSSNPHGSQGVPQAEADLRELMDLFEQIGASVGNLPKEEILLEQASQAVNALCAMMLHNPGSFTLPQILFAEGLRREINGIEPQHLNPSTVDELLGKLAALAKLIGPS